MTRGRTAHTALLAVLALLVAAAATRVASHFPGARLELSRVKLTSVTPEVEKALAGLRDDVFFTYYVTRADKMPSHLRHVEREVVDLLAALKAKAKSGRVDWRQIDPTDDQDLMKFAAKRKVAPVRVRSIAHDQYSEQEVWSTLTISYGPRPPAMIEGIGMAHLPRLQHIILEQLRQLESPRKPAFAISAPREGFQLLRADLARRGTLLEVDLDRGQSVPRDADVLFVVDPKQASADALRRLRHFQESGGSIVALGSLHQASLDPSLSTLDLKPSGEAIDVILKEFGVRVVPGLLLDRKSAAQNLPSGAPGSIFRCGCLTLNQDFQSLARDPRGTILFVAANPLQLDSDRLDALGLRAQVLASSSDDSALLPVTGASRLEASEMLAAGDPVPKQPLLAWVRPHERWLGSIVCAGTTSLVADEFYPEERLANARTVETLIETLASDQRLVMRRAGVIRPAPLPELPAAARVAWRSVVVLFVPVLLLAVFAVRRIRERARAPRPASPARNRSLALIGKVAAGIVVVAVVVRSLLAAGGSVDLTAEGVNALSPHAREIAARSGERVEVDVVFSEDARLPPELKPRLRDLREQLRRFAAAGADLVVEDVRPENLDDAGRAALAAFGITPARMTSRLEEVTTVRSFFGALRLDGHGRSEVLRFTDPEDFENAEFRIAFALERLKTGKRAKIGFASDVPRLSAGEAWQFYQQRGLIPPSGKDVFSIARELLERCDFEVVHVNPRTLPVSGGTPILPTIPSDIDALIWLQPRRSMADMLEKVVDWLYRGGRTMIAAQHFAMQSRQYRGRPRGLDFVYWPQPQSPDVEEFYFPDLGVLMVRDVLFDENNFPIALDAQLHRSGRREFESQDLAKPFCIRATSARFDKQSPITRTLSDQPFVFGSYFRLDPAKLAASGLAATPLIASSEKSWAFNWKAGWLPPGMMRGPGAKPDDDEDVVPAGYDGSQPLAVAIEGQFPWPKQAFTFPPVTVGADGQPIDKPERPPYPHAEPTADAKPGKLLMVGSSEMLKDEYLTQLRPEFRADHLLLNAAADLALGPDFASIMAHRPGGRGFERVASERILGWRAIVVFGVPALLLVLAVLRTILERVATGSRAASWRSAAAAGREPAIELGGER